MKSFFYEAGCGHRRVTGTLKDRQAGVSVACLLSTKQATFWHKSMSALAAELGQQRASSSNKEASRRCRQVRIIMKRSPFAVTDLFAASLWICKPLGMKSAS